MPSPGAPAAPRLPLEDAYLELLADTLEGLESSARGQFLQRYFRATTHLDLRENQSLQLWDEVLTRRRELAGILGRPVSLKTTLMDVLSSSGLVRVPVILEYDELKKIQLNAVTDPLTGLYNRRLFAESFEKELNRARRYGLPLGIVILDLHRFKEVNDKYGHPRGDEVLRAAATTLQKALRTSDSAFRIGGDEFALLLPQTDAAQAIALGRRIENVFAETLRPLALTFAVTMDHGVATFPQDGDQTDQLIRVADERLYRFKHANHVRTSTDSSPSVASPEVQHPFQSPISISAGRTPETVHPDFVAASSAAAAALSEQALPPVAGSSYAIQRKAERVSMVGTNAYAIIGDQGSHRARVLDLGFGGVALEFEQQEEFPESILAILHVPILPPVRVSLRPVWSRRTAEGTFRLGCHFVS
ncbi:MAG TPA: GGDEF domain-containing protein [Candidatus Limnocylindrales bacterium]|nr:GGDEF domain-containing protein [Candidatus Limnocylindrales bacterium]